MPALLAGMWAGDASAQVTQYVYVTSLVNNTVTIYSTATRLSVAGPITVGSGRYTSAITPDGQFVYITAAGGNAVNVISADGYSVATIQVDAIPTGLTLAPDGRRLYVANFGSNTLSVIDVATHTVVGTAPAGSGPNAVVVTPNGSKAYIVNAAVNSVVAIDLTTLTIVATILVGSNPIALAVAPDGLTLYVANEVGNSLTTIDTATDTVFGAPITTGTNPSSIAITPDGLTAYVASQTTSEVQAFDLVTRTLAATINLSTGPSGLAVTPDGRTVWVKSDTGNTIDTIDVATNTVSGPSIPVDPSPIGGGSQFIGPNVIAGATPLVIASDAELTAGRFGSFVNFDNGTLQLAAPWSTTRDVSFLPGGGTIDTNGFDATIGGHIVFGSGLYKVGAGRLRFTGSNAQPGFFGVIGGTLELNGTHPGSVVVQSGVLEGVGTLENLLAVGGSVSPGQGGPGILHTLVAQLVAGAALVIELNGPVAGTGYDRLDPTLLADVTDATLTLQLGYAPAGGTSFTILTHAQGTFAGLPEGALFIAGGRRFRITYLGGSGSDVVLQVDDLPTVSAFANRTLAVGAAFESDRFHRRRRSHAARLAQRHRHLVEFGAPAQRESGARRQRCGPYARGDPGARCDGQHDNHGHRLRRHGHDTGVVRADGTGQQPSDHQRLHQPDAGGRRRVDPVAFTVGDVETPPPSLGLTVTSSNVRCCPTRIWCSAAPVLHARSGRRRCSGGGHHDHHGDRLGWRRDGAGLVRAHGRRGAHLLPGGRRDRRVLRHRHPDRQSEQSRPRRSTLTFLKDDGTTIVQSRHAGADVAHDDSAWTRSPGSKRRRSRRRRRRPTRAARRRAHDEVGCHGYGAHTEKATAGAAIDWYFAEGSQGFFHDVFPAGQSAERRRNTAHVTLPARRRAAGARDYPLAATSRTTIDVAERAGAGQSLVRRAGHVRSAGHGRARDVFRQRRRCGSGGHASAGVTAPSTNWFLAEGATGTFFDDVRAARESERRAGGRDDDVSAADRRRR